MSNIENNDQEFFDKLRNYSEEPPASVKEKIDAAREKKKRRGLFWISFTDGNLFMPSLKIAAVLIGLIIICTSIYKATIKNNQVINIQPKKNIENGLNSLQEKNEIDAKKIQVNSSVITENITEKGKLNSPDIKNKLNMESHIQSVKTHSFIAKNNSTNKKISIKNNVLHDAITINSNTISNDDRLENINAEEDDVSAILNPNPDRCVDEIQDLGNTPNKLLIDTTISNKNPIDSNNLSVMHASLKMKKQFIFSIGINAEVFNQKIAYSSNNSISIDDSALSSSEDPKIGYGYSISPTIQYGNWYLSSGISYSRIREKYNFLAVQNGQSPIKGTAFEFNDTLNGSINPVNNINDISTLFNQSSANSIVILDTSVINIYSRIEIPLTIGYKIKVYKFFSMGVHTGIAYTNWKKISGTSYNIDKKVVSNFASSTEVPIRKSGWDYLFGVDLFYDFEKNWSISLQPSLSYSLTSMYDKNYAVSRKLKRQAVAIGISYKF